MSQGLRPVLINGMVLSLLWRADRGLFNAAGHIIRALLKRHP